MSRALLLSLLLPGLAGCGAHPRTWHENGVLRSEGRTNAAGREVGIWSYYYPHGELRERGPWIDGRRGGRWTQWYPGGQKHSVGERRWDDERHGALREGAWTFWYSNGQLRAVGDYERGEPVGRWTWWNHLAEVDEDRSGLYEAGLRRDP